jgi:hypothetical protein
MTEAKRPLKVFLSYASQDRPLVRELSERLAREEWIDPWVDEKKLLPGQDWRLKIDEAVETSDIVIICLSDNSVTKEGYVQKELRYAREIALEKPEETIFLVPLRLDECEVPRGLRFYQWVDYFGKKKDESYKALVESLKLRYEQKLQLEKVERVRREKERLELEAAEKAEREKAEHEALQSAAREKLEREVWEKAMREKLEREAAERLAREKAKQDELKKIRRERAERQAARKAEVARIFSRILPFSKIIFSIGGVIGLFLVTSWAMPKFLPPAPTAESAATLMQQAEPSTMHVSPTVEVLSSPTPSLTPTSSTASTPVDVSEWSFNIEHLETISVENLPNLTQLALFTYDGNFLQLSPSGKMMITDDGLIYDIETQKVVCDISINIIQSGEDEFALSDKLAAPSRGNVVWDLLECARRELSVDLGRSIAIAPNNEDVLFSTFNSDLRHMLVLLNLESGEEKKRMMLGSSMSDITISPDGVAFVASTGGGYAQMYTFSDFTFRSRFAASNLWANIISFRPDKDVLITSDEYPTTNTNIRIWRISDGRLLYSIPDAIKISSGKLGLSVDGKMYVASNGKTLSFWDIDADVEAHTLEMEKLVFGSMFSDNQKVLLVLLDGNRMAVYGVNPDF